jgi:hypothetical protein
VQIDVFKKSVNQNWGCLKASKSCTVIGGQTRMDEHQWLKALLRSIEHGESSIDGIDGGGDEITNNGSTR